MSGTQPPGGSQPGPNPQGPNPQGPNPQGPYGPVNQPPGGAYPGGGPTGQQPGPYGGGPYGNQPYGNQPYGGGPYGGGSEAGASGAVYSPIPGMGGGGPGAPGGYGPGAPGGYGPGGPSGPGGPAGGPGGAPEPGPRKRSPLLVVLIVGVALALVAVIAAIAIVVSVRNGSGSSPTRSDPASGGSSAGDPPAAPAVASAAVLAYLKALEAGDSATALAMTAEPPAERTLLTSNALEKASTRVSAISVPDVSDPAATSVQATYRVGETEVTETFPVVKIDDQWRVQQTYGSIVINRSTGPEYGVRVNGVKLDAGTYNAFPGRYAITTGSSYVSYGSAAATVRKPTDAPATVKVSPRLTKAGSARMISATKKSLNTCLGKRALAPKDCPFAASAENYTITKSTIRWKLTNKPFSNPKVRLNGAVRDLVSTNLTLKITGSVRCRSATFSGTCTVDLTRKVTASAALSGGSMKVFWRQR